MFNPSILFPAFQAAGMLESAQFTLGDSSVISDVPVGYRKPGEIEFDGVGRNDHQIEYETAKAPGLRVGNLVRITFRDQTTRDFRLMSDPLPVSDGFFSRVRLTPA